MVVDRHLKQPERPAIQAGLPESPRMLSGREVGLMATLVVLSASSQACISRAFQVETAAKSAAAGYLQVKLDTKDAANLS